MTVRFLGDADEGVTSRLVLLTGQAFFLGLAREIGVTIPRL